MSAEVNEALASRAIEELFNRGNMDVADELFAPDYVGHDPASPEDLQGPEGAKQYAAEVHAAFPDVQVTVEDQVAEGDRLATRYTFSGTHQGELMGVPPTGNRVTIAGIAVDHISGGKIEESWDNYDALGMMQQLGIMPAPEQAEA